MTSRFVLTLLAIAGLSGCASQPAGSDTYGTGANLSVDYFGDTDVVGFHFSITRVSCSPSDSITPFSYEANVDLVDGVFPAGITLIEQTLDPTSRHLGSDFFISLEPGCYDVVATPASAIDGDDWTPSADCATADAEAVSVSDGQTSEITLISQCVGDESGALDTVVVLNHPPLISVSIEEKYNYECESVEVCITAYDVDDDPLEFEWSNLSAFPEFSLTQGAPAVVGFDDGHRIWEACAEIVTQDPGSFDFQATVYDLGWLDGNQVHIEDLLDPGQESHDSLTFPLHTLVGDEPLCFAADGELVQAPGVSIDRVEGCEYTSPEEYYCSGRFEVDPVVVSLVCEGTDLIEEVLYPDCPVIDDGAFHDFDGTFGSEWETLAPPLEPLYSIQSFHTAGSPSIFNMYDQTGQAYDVLTDTWTTLLAVAPYSYAWTSMAPVDDDLWMIRNSAVYRYTPGTDTWATIAAISGGDDLNMTESDEFGMVFGHTTSGEIVEFDTNTSAVTYHPTGFGGQYETRLAYDPDGRAIFFGAYPLPFLYRWGIDDNTFSTVASIPESQLNDIFCSDRSGHIYAAGDWGGTTMFQYDIVTDTWSSLPNLPADHGNNGSCTVSEDGFLYVGTGSNMGWFRLPLY